MSRPTTALLAAVFALILAAYSTGTPPRSRVATWDAATPLWRWHLPPGPEPSQFARQAALVVRSRQSSAVSLPSGPAVALPAGAGVAERQLLTDTIDPGDSVDGTVTLHLHNLKLLRLHGVPVPLRMAAVLTRAESLQDTVAKVDGHSVMGRPLAHEAVWRDGELPLLSLRTADDASVWEWTFLLTLQGD